MFVYDQFLKPRAEYKIAESNISYSRFLRMKVEAW